MGHARIPAYARLADQGRIDLPSQATSRRNLVDINDALRDAASDRGIRHLIEF